MKPIQHRWIRHLLSASLALAITTMVAGEVLADAADPKVPSQNQTFFRAPTATSHDNGDGTTTITVTAVTDPATGVGPGWVWTTHHKDCNTDRAGVGFAVDWNDPQIPGFPVTTLNGVLIDVGCSVAKNGNAVDNVVHPTPGGRVSSTIDGTGKEVDVATPSQFALWRGGCGTFTRDLNADGILDPEGNWGRRSHVLNASGVDTGAQNGGISHTYRTSDLEKGISICALMYDVHSGKTPVQNGGVGIPSKAAEITAGGSGHNGDNGAEKNTGTPVGNACVPICINCLTTAPAVVPNDTATVRGNNPTGTVTFDLFPPSDATCSGTPARTETVTLSAGSASTSNTTFVASTVGTWRWRLTYNGDAKNPKQIGACGVENFTITNK